MLMLYPSASFESPELKITIAEPVWGPNLGPRHQLESPIT